MTQEFSFNNVNKELVQILQIQILSYRNNNGISENSDGKGIDVIDVAGGTRHHRKILLPTLPSNEDKKAEETIGASKNISARSTRSTRLRASTRANVNYNEEKVGFCYRIF